MNVARAPFRAIAPVLKPLLGLPAGLAQRLVHLIAAGIICFVLLLFAMLDPVDQLGWTLQSKLAQRAPSGDVIFVSADADVADPVSPENREELAEALTELERLGVGRVYIDVIFSEPSTERADAKLAQAIASLGPRVSLVEHIEADSETEISAIATIPEIAGATQTVASRRGSNWLGFRWEDNYSYRVDGRTLPSLSASIAGAENSPSQRFPINYGIASADIPAIDLDEIAKQIPEAKLAGRTVVIGEHAGRGKDQQRIPGDWSVPFSYADIYAAETLKSGRTVHIAAFPALAIFIAVFAALLVVGARSTKRRGLVYAFMFLSVPATFYAGSYVGIRLELSYCFVLLAVYAIIRSRARWKDRVAMVDNESGLPKLRALEVATARNTNRQGHLVVARIHGYEHVLKTLPRSERAQYILKLVDRLRATDTKLAVYAEGHYLAWHSEEENGDSLAEHLEGLRAMFAAPVNVAGSSVDVGISFGVARLDGDPAARLAAAVAAAEESSEALQPIKMAENGSHFDELWDISLRARIDEAMAAGEIFCVYQPKIDTRTGTMTGVEALVRWQDPNRGFIPPMKFIAQCEKAGRMDALTDYVLEHACAAGRLMHFQGRSISMSINISATLLSDMRIVGMVRNVIQATGFDPRFMILEVTETSRIGDLETAQMVLNELRSLGARISMDDFGVGETNFETFFELPFDEVKIDRLFIGNMAKSAKARAIVESIVEMGRKARIGVVAEGAEDEETLRMLTKMGCTHVQGYILARPMSLENVMQFKDLDDIDSLRA
ncbi:EAL domain-containing protein [Qipengyuania vesicularis]|uniref:EAL domain-containing protein n=1 Tax=Qipengyuania vesicularis TaxID=2867232 RepID=UPI001C887E21|nr:EAL domain-containing protein [Qipengyuania vesicularis]MBX7527601.1 EAL domain-containing protein [Qipengyuania vesicularis]